MKTKIIEILNRRVTIAFNDCGISFNVIDAETEDITSLSADLNAAFEQNLRDELIKFADWLDTLQPHSRTSVWSKDGQYKGLFTMDNEQLTDIYLKRKSREK